MPVLGFWQHLTTLPVVGNLTGVTVMVGALFGVQLCALIPSTVMPLSNNAGIMTLPMHL